MQELDELISKAALWYTDTPLNPQHYYCCPQCTRARTNELWKQTNYNHPDPLLAMATSSDLSKNQNINIRSKYVLHQNRHEPLFHEMLPYHAPAVFPKAPKPLHHHHHQARRHHAGGSETGDDEDTDSYRSIYRNWPQQIDDDIDDIYLPVRSSSRCSDGVVSNATANPIIDGALALAGDDDEYFIIRKAHYPALQQLNTEQRKSAAEIKHRAAVDTALNRSRCMTRRNYLNTPEHVDFVDGRVQRCLAESHRQTAELLAATRVNTQRESEERDDKQKHIRHRLFLKSKSPFSAAQSVVVSRLEEKLYATSPIDLLVQKNRTRCQYSNLPVVRRLNELAIEEERDKELNQDLVESSSVLKEARRRRLESESRAAMGDISKDLQRAIRGKSAHVIGAMLYAESMNKIKNSRNVHEANEECIAKSKSSMKSSTRQSQCREVQGFATEAEALQAMQQSLSQMHQTSSYSGGRLSHRTVHMEAMDDRALDNMNHNVINSLEACRYQLKNLSHTSSDMYAASR